MVSVSEEKSDIVELVQKYLDAFMHGDSTLMEGVFHKTAAIHGFVDGQYWAGDGEALAEFCDSNPPGKESGMNGKSTVLELTEKSASVRIDLQNYHGFTFVDYLSLQKIDGRWFVVGKCFSEV